MKAGKKRESFDFMRLLHVERWLESPTNRDIIERWSSLTPEDQQIRTGSRYRLEMEVPDIRPDAPWSFLVLGDTGDSDASGPILSPQSAVARELTRDAAVPGETGDARAVLHMGDVIYMAGEKRLYERNFRRPYNAFLTPESTVENMVFRLPFLPVLGNHDYYDLGGWTKWLSHIPLLRRGVRALTHRFLGFGVPEGGSDQGRAFMEAFLAPRFPLTAPLPYRPGVQTRLPHRYYQFTMGGIDFFALDSNTLDAPPEAPTETVRQAARARLALLEKEETVLEQQVVQARAAYEEAHRRERDNVAQEEQRRAQIHAVAPAVTVALETLIALLPDAATAIRTTLTTAAQDWQQAIVTLATTADTSVFAKALETQEQITDTLCETLSTLQTYLATLPAGDALRNDLTLAIDGVEQSQAQWSAVIAPTATENEARLHELSTKVLDIQREIALEEQRLKYQPADYDAAQFEWLDAALSFAEQERPDNWRVVYLHHPLYTTIYNHCERPDVRGMRANLLAILAKPGRVHLVLSGHAHAFEWLHSAALPNTGIFVTGGGGQVGLRSSVFTTRLRDRSYRRRAALKEAGLLQCAVAGRGPVAEDGEEGNLYHYLRITVTPEALQVHPIGVRALRDRNSASPFRREEPMPVYHMPEIPTSPDDPIRRRVRYLKSVEIRRDQPPKAYWTA